MKRSAWIVTAALVAAPGLALAQSPSPSTTNSTSNANPAASASGSTTSSPQSSNLANAQKIKQDMQNAGFQDVNVVAEAFVVEAKTKDGNRVVMTIGPHSMSAVESVGTVPSSGNASSAKPNSSK